MAPPFKKWLNETISLNRGETLAAFLNLFVLGGTIFLAVEQKCWKDRYNWGHWTGFTFVSTEGREMSYTELYIYKYNTLKLKYQTCDPAMVHYCSDFCQNDES